LIKLRTENRYREAAKAIQGELQSLHGAAHAASIVEEALSDRSEGSPSHGQRTTVA
jgi:hypothetical protein